MDAQMEQGIYWIKKIEIDEFLLYMVNDAESAGTEKRKVCVFACMLIYAYSKLL